MTSVSSRTIPRFSSRVRALRVAFPALLGAAWFVMLAQPPGPASPGLDQSWRIALTLAVQRGLVFGRDVVFTFGPWGFTVAGAPAVWAWLPFFAMSALASAFVVFGTLSCLRRSQSLLQRVALALGVFVVSLYLTADYLLLFGFIGLLCGRYGQNPRHVRAIGAVAGIVGGIGLLTKLTLGIDVCLGATAFFVIRFLDRRRRVRRSALPALASLAVGAVVVLLIPFHGSVPTAFSYLREAGILAEGFSAAMSIPGPRGDVFAAFVTAIALAVLIRTLVREQRRDVAALMAVVGFFAWKHGFVRQDAHTLAFFSTAAVLAVVGNASLRVPRNFAVGSFSALVALALFGVTTASAIPAPFSAYLSPARFTNDLRYLAAPYATTVQAVEQTKALLSVERLPPNIAAVVHEKTVDVVPWEVSLVAANDLRWQPQPVFQAYGAYTTVLDELNAREIATRGAQDIFYKYLSIDGRYPIADEPATMNEIICRYDASPQPMFSLPPDSTMMLLQRAPGDDCRERTLTTLEAPQIHQGIPVPAGAGGASYIRAFIDVDPTLLGKLATILWRGPRFWLEIRYYDGTSARLRVIPDVARDGIVINPALRDDIEARAFFQGGIPSTVREIAIDADPRFYRVRSIRFDLVTRTRLTATRRSGAGR